MSVTSSTLPASRLSRALAGAAFLLGLLTIAGAWGSQLIGGLVPCELCLEQRMAYYWGLPILAIVLLAWDRVPRSLWLAGLLAVIAVFIWGTYMALYHAGVEWAFWPGPTACSGAGVAVDFSQLQDVNAAKVVPCDVVQFRFLGLSLAGYNALAELGILVLLAASVVTRRRG